MRIAYLTTDEVNEDLAFQLADECGVILFPLSAHAAASDGRPDAVLYDWDSLPPDLREETLLASLANPSSCPVGVHGFSLDEEEVEALHQDGVAVFQRLGSDVFRMLRRLSRPRARGHRDSFPRRQLPAAARLGTTGCH